MIISIGGMPGSGKSTIAKMLADKLGWPRYYIGGLRREKARQRGMTLEAYNRLGETDPSTDLEVDEYQKKLGEGGDNFIIEGRTSWHFIPHSLKIFLDVDENVGAQRIFKDVSISDSRNEGADIKTLCDVIKLYRQRIASDDLRYRKYFGIKVYDRKNYDLVVDTTGLSSSEVFDRIWRFIKDRI